MKHRMLAVAAAVSAFAAAAPAAQAGIITYEGDTLVYTSDDQVDDVILTAGDTDGYIKFYEYAGAGVSSTDGRCQAGYEGLECQIPSAMRVVLNGGDDEFSLNDLPADVGVSISGGAGNDVLKDDYAESADRRFEGGDGNDTIEAYGGDDVVLGDGGNDVLKGGAGADEVRGGDGNDELEGDKYEAQAADVIDGGNGFDLMEEYSIPSQDINPPASVTQDGVADDGRPGEGDNVTGVEKITSHVNGTYNGTEGDDDIWIWSNINEGESTINGHGGADKLTGLDHPERIDGGAGADVIEGGYGNDTIVGGPGADRINSDGGSYCGLYDCKIPFGDDTVDARDGEVDQVECGIGNDTVQADEGDQVAPSCENVTRGGGGGGPGPGPGPGPDQPGAVAVSVAGKAKAAKLRKSGLKFSVDCDAACTVSGTLKKGSKTVGKGKRTLLAAGKATVKVKLTKAGKKAVKKGRKTKLSLKVSVKDASGATRTASKKITVK